MNHFIIFKSFLLVFILYISFIFNNSISSFFSTDILLTALFLAFIFIDLCNSLYEIIFNTRPDLSFSISVFFFSFFVILNIPFFSANFMIFVGLAFYNYCNSFLNRFGPYDDQLRPIAFCSTQHTKDFDLISTKGILFSKHVLQYTKKLSFMANTDRKNFLDLCKNNRGIITFTEDVSITFTLTKKSLKFFSHAIDDLLYDITDIDNMVVNLLIEKT